MSHLSGFTSDLKSQQIHRLEKLLTKKIPPDQIITQEFARQLTELSFAMGRQLGVLVNRLGYVEHVVVGDTTQIELPDLKRVRSGGARFRGLRLLHTHLKENEGLSEDDLTDLSLLRLDLVAAITMDTTGLPQFLYMAHLLPENPDNAMWRVFPPLSPSLLDENFRELIQALEEEFNRSANARLPRERKNRAVLIGVYSRQTQENEHRMLELSRLAETAGISIIDTITQIRSQPDPRYCVGQGKLRDIVIRSMQSDGEILIFDNELSTSQTRSLATYTDLKIIDRTQLILDIFAQHARSKDGKLQVELAQLKYLKTRLSEKDDSMSRLTGGIGGRGPGETKLEIGKRRVTDRIALLEREIRKLRTQRELRRKFRQRREIPVVSIVGYTNAGKSTLLNAMTRSETLTQDALFATLDPTTRRIKFPENKEIILTDTVGFIQDLPPALMQAFKATLEEMEDATLLLLVVDASSSRVDHEIRTVQDILRELNLHEIPLLYVFNQIDKIEGEVLWSKMDYFEKELGIHGDQSVFISALHQENLPQLTRVIEQCLWQKKQE